MQWSIAGSVVVVVDASVGQRVGVRACVVRDGELWWR